MLWEGKLEQVASNSAKHWNTMGCKHMLSRLAKLVLYRDIMICPKSHSELKIEVRSSLHSYCSYLVLTGFLPVLPRGRAAFFFTKQKQMCLSKHCDFCKTAFVVCTERWGTVSIGQQQPFSVPGFGKVFEVVVWKQISPGPGTDSLASVDLGRISGAFQAEIPLPASEDEWVSGQGREINPFVRVHSELILTSGLQ